MKPNKVGEEQATDLTERDVQPEDTPTTDSQKRVPYRHDTQKRGTDTPAPFHFRKSTMANLVHLLGSLEEGKKLRPAEFKNWEVTEFKPPAIWKTCVSRPAMPTDGVLSIQTSRENRTS